MKNPPPVAAKIPMAFANPFAGFDFWKFLHSIPWWFWLLPVALMLLAYFWLWFNFYRYD